MTASSKRVSAVIIDARSRKIYWSLFALVGAMVCAPLWATKYPPLLDYPNHLARAYVIYHYDDNRFYRNEYDKLFEPIPNMAIDLIVPPLLRFFEIKTAGKIFLTLAFLLFALGCHMLSVSVHGRPTWLVLSFAFLIFNQTVFWGFVNYFFGVGLFLISFSLWLRYRKSWTWWKLGLTTLLVFASFIAHLSAYAFLGVGIATVTLFDLFAAKHITKKMLAGITPLVPPLVTFAVFMRGTGSAGELVWGNASGKIQNLASWPIGYNYVLDGVLLVLILLAGAWVLLRSKRMHISWPIMATALIFWALYLICPLAIFTSYSADIRFVAPAIVFTLLAARFKIEKRLGLLALGIFLLASTIRIGGIYKAWRRIDEKTEAQLSLFNNFEEGARVYPITFFPPDKEGSKNERPIHHIIHYSTIYQHTFSPTFFAYRGQQPVLYKERPRYVKITQQKPPEAMDWSFIFDNYDYIWGYEMDDAYRKFLTARCDIVAENEGGVIFRIRKDKEEKTGLALK